MAALHGIYMILATQPEVEPTPPAVEGLTTGLLGKCPDAFKLREQVKCIFLT